MSISALSKIMLLLIACVLSSPAIAQHDDAPAPGSQAGPDTELPTDTGSEEAELSEDNYRRYMELKGHEIDRSILPTAAYIKPKTLEKLQNLPESSQKHLRNQLRDIILQGDRWSPEDKEAEYPYTPSEAAINNPQLQRHEGEAWLELVDEYHQREADIYAHSTRSQAATMSSQGGSEVSSQGMGSNSANQGDDSGHSQSGRSGASNGSRSSQALDAVEASVFGTSSSEAATEISTSGVSQNALEFLLKSGAGNESREADSDMDTESAQPLEFVAISGDTLSIKDLSNARGVIVTAPVDPSASSEKDEEASRGVEEKEKEPEDPEGE